MEIGRRLYYDKKTGNIIVDTGERSGDVLETTQEQDFEVYKSLAERVPETVGVIELEYGQYRQDFIEGVLTRIDPETKDLMFSYPDPQEPGEPTPPQPALSKQVTLLKAQLQAQTDRADFIEDCIAEMATMLYI